ncbi:prostaglandin reductase 1 [Agrilus planipennis]|uniref:Prostaglandin reductase 1 n=2 Tax=Agrilus planipennis TaxID=224129 RepID=A0A7F5R2V1_AGRPL|nr:prostaglandin reductase 1 [Agrilus planipennis]
MMKARKFILVQHFKGLPKKEDVKIVEEELPPLKTGEFLAEAVYLSVDPYMRAYEPRFQIGSSIIGGQVAKILESKNPEFPVGAYIFGSYGWRTHTVGPIEGDEGMPRQYRLPDFAGHPYSLALGVLGMPGNTAYFGFLDLCKPKEGETVVVSGAAGAVGSIVGQIAKIKKCKVIGIAGSDEKGKWLTDELGFDHFINYKTSNVAQKLKEAAPNGIDCYFDNVGGEISSNVIHQMNKYGRISVCGAIASYNDDYLHLPKATIIQTALVFKELRMEGFLVTRWMNRWMDGINQNLQWIKEGKLKYRETVTEGFENMLNALVDILQGGNTGKAIVKV